MDLSCCCVLIILHTECVRADSLIRGEVIGTEPSCRVTALENHEQVLLLVLIQLKLHNLCLFTFSPVYFFQSAL